MIKLFLIFPKKTFPILKDGAIFIETDEGSKNVTLWFDGLSFVFNFIRIVGRVRVSFLF